MKKNLILFLILALIAAVYFWDKQQQAAKEEREEKEKELLTLTKEEIHEITIVKGEDTFKAVKQGDRWNLVQPLETSGDKSAWDSIATNYASGKHQRVIVDNPESLAPYGLDQPAIQVSLAGIGGATRTDILIGSETPTTGKYYAMVRGSSEVVTVMSSLYFPVNKNLHDLRDKTILDMQTDEVQRVQIAHGEMNVTLDKRGTDQWLISQPFRARADDTKIRDMINKIRNGEIKTFVEENPESLIPYGLVDSATKLVFWTGQAGNESSWASRALLLGATSVTDRIYAMREGQKNVFTVSPQDFNNVPARIEDLRLKKICPMRYWEVDQLKVVSAGQTILEASKSGGNWTMLQPKQGTANYNSVSDAARAIADLEAAGFVLGTTEEYGLASPDLVIELVKHTDSLAAGSAAEPTGVVREILTLAFPPNQPAGEAFYYGARPDPLEIYRIEKAKIDELVRKVNAVTREGEITPATAPEKPSATEPEIQPVTSEASVPAVEKAAAPGPQEPDVSPAAEEPVAPAPEEAAVPSIPESQPSAETNAGTPAPATPDAVSPTPESPPEAETAAPDSQTEAVVPAEETPPEPASPPDTSDKEMVDPSSPETPDSASESTPPAEATVPNTTESENTNL